MTEGLLVPDLIIPGPSGIAGFSDDPNHEPGRSRSERLLWRRLEWERCQRSLPYYIERWVWCEDMDADPDDPDANPLCRMELFDAQHEILTAMFTYKHLLLLKTRRLGFTTLMCAAADWLCRFRQMRRVVMVNASRDAAADLMLNRLRKQMDPMLPDWMKDISGIVNKANYEIKYSNGSSIVAAALGRGNPARGDTVHLIVADEWVTYEDPEQTFEVLSPAVEGRGRHMVMGTTSDRRNHSALETLWKSADDKGIHKMFHGWASRPGRTAGDYEREFRKYGAQGMAIQYPRTVEEAFSRSSRKVFDQAKVAKLAGGCSPPLATWGWNPDEPADAPADRRGRFEPATDDNGLKPVLEIWDWPEPLVDYAAGADVAHGVEHGHYAAAIVVRVAAGEPAAVVAVLRVRVSPGVYGLMLDRLGRMFNIAVVAPETFGGGMATLEVLTRITKYPRLFRHFVFDQASRRQRSERIGFRTQADTKYPAVMKLDRVIRDGDFECRSAQVCKELARYEHVDDPSGKASTKTAGVPDDCVDAGFIAVTARGDMLLHPRRYPKAATRLEPLKLFSREWWRKYAAAINESSGSGMVGPSPAQTAYRDQTW